MTSLLAMKRPTSPPRLKIFYCTAFALMALMVAFVARTSEVSARVTSGITVRDCGSAVYGQLAKNWRRTAITSGAISFVQGKYFAQWSRSSLAPVRAGTDRYRAQKVLAIVDPGATVTLIVPAVERQHFALLYDLSKLSQPARRVSSGEWKVTFHACRSQPTDGFTNGFNGGFIVAGPRCVVLDMYTRGKGQQRLALPLGVARC
jgi:hypothetical protein